MTLWWDGCDVVRCGFWVNWSTNSIHGSTLTLPTPWGLILVGFLALFVKLAGEHLWGILCFTIHQLNASSKSQDDIHHQFQLVLRNTESEGSLVSQLLKVGWTYKGYRLEAYRRSFIFFILALIHGLGFWAAGGLSSTFISQNNEVQLLSDKSCGWMAEPPDILDLTDEKMFEEANALVVMMKYGFKKSSAYARSCYMQSGGNSTVCGTYVQPALPLNITPEAACPFDEKICNGKAIVIDSGYIRSDDHLGINTRPEDSILARKVLTCAPLLGEKYTDGWITIPSSLNLTLVPEGTVGKGYKFGPLQNSNFSPLSQYTFWSTNLTIPFGDLPYRLGWFTSSVNYDGLQQRSFEPIPELQSPTADLNVIGLLNRNFYRTPIIDPWFSSENETADIIVGTSYSTTNVISFLGCQERYEFCTYDNKSCSPFTGLFGINASDSESSPSLNPTQRAVFELTWNMMRLTQLNFQLGFIGRDNLVANEYLWDSGFGLGISAALPSDHWQKEVANWMNTTLASLQRWPTAIARPPEFDIGPGISSRDHIVPLEAGPMQELCRKMKAKSPIHMSFSVLGLFITISVGLFLIFCYNVIPKVVANLQKRIGGQHKRLEWIETSAFQLQRMAAEGRGIGPWIGRDEDVPRLENHSHRFNLTEQSLKGAYSRVESYDIAKRGLGSPGLDGAHEMGDLGYNDSKRPPVGTRTRTDDSQMGLLSQQHYS